MPLPSMASEPVQLRQVRSTDLHELHTVRIWKCLLPPMPRAQLPAPTQHAILPRADVALPKILVRPQNLWLIRGVTTAETY